MRVTKQSDPTEVEQKTTMTPSTQRRALEWILTKKELPSPMILHLAITETGGC